MERKIEKNAVVDVGLTNRNKMLVLDGDISTYDLRGMKKSFPNVTTLKIMKGVKNIRMLNRTFPNIRKVVSLSEYFRSDAKMLVKKIASDGKYDIAPAGILLNSFCLKEDETLNLSNIYEIANMALDGCESKNVINTDSLEYLSKNDLIGSAFYTKDVCNGDGPIMLGDCLIGFKKSTSSFELTNQVSNIVLLDDYNKPIPLIVVKDVKLLKLFRNVSDDVCVCDKLYIKDSSDFTEELKKGNLCLPGADIQITPDNKYLKTENGAICNADKTIVYTASWFLSGKVKIPHGVQEIDSLGYPSEGITELEIPDSVKHIYSSSFWNAERLSTVKYGGKNLPEGCIQALSRSFLPFKDEGNNVIEFIGKNAHIFIPRYIEEKDAIALDDLCSKDMASVEAYKYAASDTVKYDTIVKSFEFSKDEKLLAMMKDEATSALTAYVKAGRAEAAIHFIGLVKLDAKNIPPVLEKIKKDKDISAGDYDAFLTKLKKIKLFS